MALGVCGSASCGDSCGLGGFVREEWFEYLRLRGANSGSGSFLQVPVVVLAVARVFSA